MNDGRQQDISSYDEKDLILFEEGLFGFEEYKRFLPLAIDETDDSGDMMYLQSVDEMHLSFLVMNPFILMEEYTPVLHEADMKAIGAEKDEELAYYVLCVIKETPEASTVNLKCPVVINVETRMARQIAMDGDRYGLRHTLGELADKEGASC